MNSIASLNKKWWYRLLKVIFWLSFLAIVIASTLFIYARNRVVFKNDAQITCNYGNHKVFYANRDKGIPLDRFDPSASKLPDGLNTQLMQACAITDADVKKAQADSVTATAKLRANEHCDQSDTGIRRLLCDSSISKKTYNINPVRVPIDNSGQVILYVILDIAACYIVFEFVKRTFYYVALGSVRPPRS